MQLLMHWAELAYRPWFEYIVGIRTSSESSFAAESSVLECTEDLGGDI